jgi:hypothetical protein
MTRTIWNKTTRTYTVSNGAVIVRNIPAKTQADCVAMELRNEMTPSFGETTK